MFKNIMLGIMVMLSVSLFATPVLAQERRDLATDNGYSISSDDYNQTYDNLGQYFNSDQYDYNNLTPAEQAVASGIATLGIGVLIAMVGLSLLIGLASYIFTSLAYSKIANRVKNPNGWWAWVPILNLVLLAQLGDINPWSVLLFIIPGINVIYLIYLLIASSMRIAQKLGLDRLLGLLVIIPFVQYVFIGYFAWGNFEKKSEK